MTRQKAIISWSIAEFLLLAVLVILWISEAVSTTVFLILMIAIGVISSGIVLYIVRKLPPKDSFNNENTY